MLMVRMLGGLSVERAGEPPVPLEGQLYGALLAQLALRPGRALSRELLLQTHWPGVPLSAARNRLSVALNALRRLLEREGETVLLADRQSVALDPVRVQTDVIQFEQACEAARHAADPAARRSALERAWRLYAGPLLSGFPRAEWIHIERERLACAQEDIEKALQIEEAVPHVPAPAPAPEPAPAPVPEGPAPGASLPQPLTRFFGRQAELVALRQLVAGGARLITLLGAGGMGKTRLATEAARDLLAAGLRRQAVWVPLADARSSEALERGLLLAAGLSPGVGEPVAMLAGHLTGQAAVLVVDNAEHLVEEAAEVLARLLARAPDLVALVTSQRTLLLDGEHVLRLGPLPAASDATALLVDRIRHHRPDYAPDAEEQAALVALVERLDALPLALELAAARLRQGSAAEALQDTALPVLVDRRRQRPQRQRSLESALDWSLSLIPPELGSTFVQLSIFRGEISVEAAAAVLQQPDADEVLLELSDCSLLVPVADAAGRYRMLPTVRALAAARVPADERAALRQRFAAWWMQAAQRWNAALVTGQAQQLSVALGRDWPNLDAALDMVTPTQAATALAQTVIHTLWTGRAREVLPRLEALIGHPEAADWSTALQANVARSGHRLALVSGQAAAAQRWRERAEALLARGIPENEAAGLWGELAVAAIDRGALSVAREIGERMIVFEEGRANLRNVAVHLDSLARVAFFAGDFEEARRRLLQAREILGEQIDPQLREATGLLLASCLLELQEVEQGVAMVEEIVARRRAMGHPDDAATRLNLATAALSAGDSARAEALLREALQASTDLRMRAYCLNLLAVACKQQGAWTRALAAAEEAEAAFVAIMRPIELPRPVLVQAICHAHLGAARAEVQLKAGLVAVLAVEGERFVALVEEAVALVWPDRAAALAQARQEARWRPLVADWLAP